MEKSAVFCIDVSQKKNYDRGPGGIIPPGGGYTLMEMVMVIVTIGILSAMALPRFGNVTPTAADANAESMAGAMGVAAANYNTRCTLGVGPCSSLACTRKGLKDLIPSITETDYDVTGSPETGCLVKHVHGIHAYPSETLLP